ncbi:beta-ketoacyl synthase N-terminal-like domain-containing protein [Pedobacter sp. P351]|uniref:beta-ketoacyl synthase N-terminal-like domain-containing protein n=1 Tax=Pedobacter superstes TaxID=3133441 RepID=UPI003099F2AF
MKASPNRILQGFNRLENFIAIKGYGSISALGHDLETIRKSYQSGKANFQLLNNAPIGSLQKEGSVLLEQLITDNKIYKGLDRSVLMAIYASRKAVQNAGWPDEDNICVNIGSSRGATALVEQYLKEFNEYGTVSAVTSPLTTLGNISSWVAQDLNATGPAISHSVTCSTGLQAIANGFAWLKSGMAKRFLAGASEAPLTPFTIAQMKALGIYSDDNTTSYPCRPLNEQKQNTFVLGEGAGIFALEMLNKDELLSDKSEPIIIESIGFGFENIKSKTGISKEGQNFTMAIKNALNKSLCSMPVDLIIMHAPGTVAGDYAELNAIQEVFKITGIPAITSSKWMTGHTLGASACLSLDYAIHILKTQSYLEFPYPVSQIAYQNKKSINRILVTAAGFGGNAAALIVSTNACIKFVC